MKAWVVVVALALALAACGQQQDTGLTDPFIGGNVGLNMYLMNGMPPPTVFDGGSNPFPIGVVLENAGEADIGPNTANPSAANAFLEVRLEGILPQNYGITEAQLVQTPTQPIRGAKKNFDGTILPGDVYNAIWQPLNFAPDLQGNQAAAFRIVACYDYRNFASAQLCMANDVLQNVQDSTICTLSGPKPVANSGGPLHVTEVTQNPMDANKIQVNFKIQHDGTGEWFGRDANEHCDSSVRNINKYKTHVKVTTQNQAANTNILCYRLGGTNEGDLTMYQGAPQMVTCVITGAASGARIYPLPLNIELSYRYGEFIEDQFVIQAVPN